MKLSELLSVPLLEEMIHDGYIVRRWHRDWDLAILNYTDKAQFGDEWNPVTRQCRGLIVRYDDDFQDAEVIARPFPKFFNYGQPGADEIGLDEPAHVTDKMDGSLGIAYRTPDGELAIATRGSFHSEQAEWATAWLRHNLAPKDLERLARWTGTYTDLFEIIYPENRIVLDYGERAELVYLASVHLYLGEVDRFPRIAVPTSSAPLLAGSLRDALALEPRENAEGVVVMTDDGRAVKLKQEDYLLKHRARFSLTPMRVWEAWSAGVTLDQFIEGLPDEMHDAVMEAWGSIETAALAREFAVLANHALLPDTSRKEQAAWIFEEAPDLAAELFALLDGNDEKFEAAIRKAVKPIGPAASRLIA